MWGWEWGGWDTKLRKQPNSNYFPICPLHSSVGTMHLWSIVTKAQQDSNWFVIMCRKGVFLAISPRWSHHEKICHNITRLNFFQCHFQADWWYFLRKNVWGCQRGGGAQPIDSPSEQLHDLRIKIKDHQDKRLTKV